jgi:hypothetical protein
VTANASPSGVQSTFFFMLSPSSRSTAKPAAAWQLRYSFIFLIDEMQSRFMKSNSGLKNCRSRQLQYYD